MKIKMNIYRDLSLLFAALLPSVVFAQSESDTINRTVTVEREFQPTIQSAGKIQVTPEATEQSFEPVEVQYNTSAAVVDVPQTPIMNNLAYSATSYPTPHQQHGFVRVGVGHPLTQFDFNYRMSERRNVVFDINANHLGQWGRKTYSEQGLGLNFTKMFRNMNLFVGVDGKNIFLTRYGRYFTYNDIDKMKGSFNNLDHYKDFESRDKNSQWEIATKIGIKSQGKSNISYLFQTGYEAFIMKQDMTEHIINTQGQFCWSTGSHRVGGNLEIQNHIFSADLSDFTYSEAYRQRGDTVINNHHAIKVEPYYAYEGKKFNIHIGVNLDFCAGKGKVFLPSPNVLFEAKLTEDWLALFGGVTGDYNISSVREHFQILRYLHAENEIATTHNRTYTPVNAMLGLKIRPINTLLITINAAYNYTMYDVFYVPDSLGFFNLTGSDHTHWTIAGKIDYHYKDYVNVSFNAFYNIWKMRSDVPGSDMSFYKMFGLKNNHILDRPSWGVSLRVDGKIDNKWTLYSENIFGGGRYALTLPDAEGIVRAVELKPTIDLNLGVQYNINRWLGVYLQLNNIINRKHDIVYGYQSCGINFLAGLTYSF